MFTQKTKKNVLQIFCQTESIFFDKTNRKVKENCFKQIQSDLDIFQGCLRISSEAEPNSSLIWSCANTHKRIYETGTLLT